MAKTDKVRPPITPQSGFGNVPGNIPRQTPQQAAAQDEPPDSQEMLEAFRVMATPKMMVIGGHLGLVFLTNYRPGFGYDGEHHRNYSMNTGEKTPVVTSVHGAIPYAPDARSEFVFVECGADTSVLRNLQRHLQARETPVETKE